MRQQYLDRALLADTNQRAYSRREQRSPGWTSDSITYNLKIQTRCKTHIGTTAILTQDRTHFPLPLSTIYRFVQLKKDKSDILTNVCLTFILKDIKRGYKNTLLIAGRPRKVELEFIVCTSFFFVKAVFRPLANLGTTRLLHRGLATSHQTQISGTLPTQA